MRVTEPERDARSLSQDAQEALRVRGVKLLLEGWTQAAAAEALGVGERQVRRWRKRYDRGGWKALAKRRRGRDSESQMTLSAGQQARLAAAISSAIPISCGFLHCCGRV